MFLKTSEDFLNMFAMFFQVVGVDQNIVQVNQYADVEHIRKDIVNKVLKGGWAIS